MRWQKLVSDVGGELVENAAGLLIPAFRAVVVTVPRQSGKTTLILGWEVQRATGWLHLGPQRIVYSAQTGNDARKKLIEDQVPLLEPKVGTLGIRQILKGMGNEAIVWRNGSRLGLMNSGEDAGHGKTVDLGVKDEFFADVDDRRDQALGPSMITREAAQTLTSSTMGTDASIPLNQLVARGRAAVEAGERQGIAYFEWSADPDDDPDDPRVWWACMPALGITMTEEAVRHERFVTFGDAVDEFKRAYLNIRTSTDAALFPAATWDLVNGPDVAPKGDVTFGLDVNPERSAASILAVADGEGEVIEHRPGTGWLLDRALELDERWGEPLWAVDGRPSSPVASFIPEMRRQGMTVVEVGGDMSAACGQLFDAVVDQRIRVRRHASLDAAVAGADQRFAGDGWTWDRRHSAGDICPLVALTVAVWVDSEMGSPNIF